VASDLSFAEFVMDQLEPEVEASFKRMFGEFGLYSADVFFGVICDNRMFVKPTAGGRAFMGAVTEAPPYPGAKPSFLIGDRIEDPEWLSELVRITVGELPPPKPKRARKKGKKKG